MRSLKDTIAKGKPVDIKKLITKEEVMFYNFLMSKDKEELSTKNIIELRDEFLFRGGFHE
jgi:hypothetical protein